MHRRNETSQEIFEEGQEDIAVEKKKSVIMLANRELITIFHTFWFDLARDYEVNFTRILAPEFTKFELLVSKNNCCKLTSICLYIRDILFKKKKGPIQILLCLFEIN